LDIDKGAAFGASVFIKHIIKFLLYILNQKKIQYFDSKDEAMEWLLEDI